MPFKHGPASEAIKLLFCSPERNQRDTEMTNARTDSGIQRGSRNLHCIALALLMLPSIAHGASECHCRVIFDNSMISDR